MKVAILAGGLGTRLAEFTEQIPKPMVEIGGRPILWHIMRGFACQGFKEFVVALGYKSEVIKDYFIHYRQFSSESIVVNLSSGNLQIHGNAREDWKVHLLETGEKTHTGGRIRRVMRYLKKESLMVTYGDGLCDVDLRKLLQFHRSHGKAVTVTAVRPPARFGGLKFKGDFVSEFTEKPQIGEGWINGGFFVVEPRAASYIEGDQTLFEREPLENLAKDGELVAYRHEGFWQCMDTLRDLRQLQAHWESGKAPWMTWVS